MGWPGSWQPVPSRASLQTATTGWCAPRSGPLSPSHQPTMLSHLGPALNSNPTGVELKKRRHGSCVSVSSQVVELLHIRDKITAQQFQRVATRAALTMVEDRPQFAGRYLLGPLLSPLQRCSGVTGQYLVLLLTDLDRA